MELKAEDDPVVVVINSNNIVKVKLTTAVDQVKLVQRLLDENRFQEAIELRGRYSANFTQFFLSRGIHLINIFLL